MDAPQVQYVTTQDGFKIAYAVSGSGAPFVFMPHEFSHIQLLWQGSYMLPWLEGLASRFRLIQYDGRGKGMSSRGLPPDSQLMDCYLDFLAVVDRLQLRDFVLMTSAPIQCYMAVRFAVENPDRVRCLILASPTVDRLAPQALIGSFAGEDWESFLHSMAGLIRAKNLEDEVSRMKRSTTQEDWLALVGVARTINLELELPRVNVPTLVLHPGDYVFPVGESMKVAAAIPNARLVLIDGTDARGDPAQGLNAIDDFLASLPAPGDTRDTRPDGLSVREVEVLRLIARGRSNPQIAQELVISVNTVQNHVSSILAKAGLVNRAEASSYAQRRGLGT